MYCCFAFVPDLLSPTHHFPSLLVTGRSFPYSKKMKLSTALFVLAAGSAQAFAPAATRSVVPPTARFSSVADPETTEESKEAVKNQLNNLEKEIEGIASEEVNGNVAKEPVKAFVPPPGTPSISTWDKVEPGRYAEMENSVALPFLKRPTNLDGSHAGDYGFDPLGLSEQFDLYTMMEAEVRHARLAMLAVIGWPLSELIAPNWFLQGPNHLAPSVLNGFNPVTFLATAAIFGGLGFFEFKTSLRMNSLGTDLGKKHESDMREVWKYGVPGDYNFDPLNLYNSFGDSATGRKAMRELEISHGRWAMMAITSFAAWEALTGHAVVENSMFFEPNLALPALGAAYLAFGFFYEIENDDQYLFQIRQTSEGEMRMGEMQRKMKGAGESAAALGPLAESAIEGAKGLKEKLDQWQEDYNESKISYTDKQ